MVKSTNQPVVVIPNLNGGSSLLKAVESLMSQTLQPHIIVVDNASIDDSIEQLSAKYTTIEIIRNIRNMGYAGGVNPGFRRAIERGAEYVAPFNDDAIADKDWLQYLVEALNNNPTAGSANPKVLKNDALTIDSTGDYLTNWGLPFPRGREETDSGQYDVQLEIFAASGAASLYRVSALNHTGLLDEDFFAYYEDVDLGFRLQLSGWKAIFVPQARVYHEVGMTSGRIKGFTTYQTMKNLPLLVFKNIPRRYLWGVVWRLTVARTLFLLRAASRGQTWPAVKGDAMATYLIVKKWRERTYIQKTRVVSDEYIWRMLVHDLPPNAKALRALRGRIWKLRGRS